MARSRNIKPGFFKNEDLSSLDPYTRLLFIGLWTYADKEGRFEVRLEKIKAEIFPYEQVMLEPCMAQLWDKHFLTFYEAENRHFGLVNNWKRHQSPHHKEVDSELPPIEEEKVFISQEDMYAWLKHESCMNQSRFKQNASSPLIPDSGFSDSGFPSDATSFDDDGSIEDDPPPDETQPPELPKDDPVVCELPTNKSNTTGEKYPVKRSQATQWVETYPACDVRQELKKIRAWLDANQQKRKTYGGMPKFINNWLSRQQDKGGSGHEKRHSTSADRWAINHEDTSWLTGDSEGPGNCIDGELDLSEDADNLHSLEAGGGGRH